jgi:hypothetical protein
MLKQMRVKVYVDFEHLGLPFSLSVIPELNLFIFTFLCFTIAAGEVP